MEKLSKQMTFNIALLLMSILIIYISSCLRANGFVAPIVCLNSDFLLVLITTLASMLCWRWVDEISGHLIWNAISIFILAAYLFIFGVAIVKAGEEFVTTLILICSAVFVFAFVGEVIVILLHTKAEEKTNNSIADADRINEKTAHTAMEGEK